MLHDKFEVPTSHILSIQSDTRRATDRAIGSPLAPHRTEAPSLGSQIDDTEGHLLVPIGAIVDLLGAQPLEIDELRDHLGSALRIYARRFEGRSEVALLQRGSDERWKHLGWNPVSSDINVFWYARTVLDGTQVRYELDSAEVRLI
ncbi:MAG: hypothetical protein IPK97_08050 [Ahniella sp.]|nr:hypothetical protein [Ahniella sp.]